MTAATYRKKPVQVQAVQWCGDNAVQVEQFAGCNFELIDPAVQWCDDPEATAAIRDVRRGGTWQPLYTGDWVTKDVWGATFPVRAAEFAETYEPVEGMEPPKRRACRTRDVGGGGGQAPPKPRG